eukprot:664080-Prymnesium_polylepis.1
MKRTKPLSRCSCTDAPKRDTISPPAPASGRKSKNRAKIGTARAVCLHGAPIAGPHRPANAPGTQPNVQRATFPTPDPCRA